MLKRIALALFAAAAGSSARADLSATYTGGSFDTVSYTFNGNATSGGAGSFTFTKVGGTDAGKFGATFTGYCVDLAQTVSQGTTYTYSVGGVASLPQIGGTPASATATKITEYWGRHYATSLTNSANAAAFQVGLWELVYDNATPAGVSLSTGKFQATGAAATTAGGWLAALNSGPTNSFAANYSGKQLVGLVSGSAQDQLTMVAVPAPAGLLLGGVGLGMLAIRRRVSRKA